jgi:hypothetical protein
MDLDELNAQIEPSAAVMLEGDPETALIFAGGAVYMVDAGVPIDLAALAIETAATSPLAVGRQGTVQPESGVPCRHLPISYFARFGGYSGRQGC